MLNTMDEIIRYIQTINFQEYLDELALKYKSIVFYGAGQLADYIMKNYDISRLNIIGIADKKFFVKESDLFNGIKKLNPLEISELTPEVIVFTVLRTDQVAPYLTTYLPQLTNIEMKSIFPDYMQAQITEIPISKNNIYYPKYIYLSITSKCNLKCRMCTQHGEAEEYHTSITPELVSFDYFKHVIDQIDFDCMVDLGGKGEVFIHPQFIDFCKYLNNKKIPFRFITNGVLFNKTRQKELTQLEFLHNVAFSVDSMNKQYLENKRVGVKFEKLIENINSFIDIKQPHTEIGFSITLDSGNDFEFDTFIDHWASKVDYLQFVYEREAKTGFQPYKYNWMPERIPCEHIFYSTLISNNGDVLPCCNDLFNKYILGNVNQQNIKDIWLGKKYQNLRTIQLEKMWDNHTLCKNCSYWADSLTTYEEDREKGISIITTPYSKTVKPITQK